MGPGAGADQMKGGSKLKALSIREMHTPIFRCRFARKRMAGVGYRLP